MTQECQCSNVSIHLAHLSRGPSLKVAGQGFTGTHKKTQGRVIFLADGWVEWVGLWNRWPTPPPPDMNPPLWRTRLKRDFFCLFESHSHFWRGKPSPPFKAPPVRDFGGSIGGYPRDTISPLGPSAGKMGYFRLASTANNMHYSNFRI